MHKALQLQFSFLVLFHQQSVRLNEILEECTGSYKRNVDLSPHLTNLRIVEAIPFTFCETSNIGTVVSTTSWSWMSNNSKKLILPGSLWRATKSNFQCSNSHLPLAEQKQQPGQQECAFHKESGERLDWPWGSCLFHSYPQSFACQLWASSLPGDHGNVKKEVRQQRGSKGVILQPTLHQWGFAVLHFPFYFSVRGTDPQCGRLLSAAWQSCCPPDNLNSVANNTAWETARNGVPLSWTGDLCKAAGLLLTEATLPWRLEPQDRSSI